MSGSLDSVLLVWGSLGELAHFPTASPGVWGQGPGGFSPLDLGMLDQALRGTGYLVSGSLCGV